MKERDMWSVFPSMPKKVTIGDITIRDGFQHEEKFISTRAKIYYLEQMIFAGCRHLEVTNLGNSYLMPQFSDGEEIFRYLRGEQFFKKCLKKNIDPKSITLTAVTIREKAVDKAIALRKEGVGPDRVLMMVSTDEKHHIINSGTSLADYWQEAERSIKKCNDAGIKMCGTVSTIWGSPCGEKKPLSLALDFTKRWFDIGAHDVEHADHDGQASAPEVYRYFATVLDAIPDSKKHIAHFHETRRIGSASVLAALQAGISHFEATLGGIGGQPTNFLDDCPVGGTGEYYYNPLVVGLITMEDTLVQLTEMGIEHNIKIDEVLRLGKEMEKTLGRRLRSEAIINGLKLS